MGSRGRYLQSFSGICELFSLERVGVCVVITQERL